MKIIRSRYKDYDSYIDCKISIAFSLYFIMSVFNSTVKVIFPEASIVSYMSLLSGCGILIGYMTCINEVFRREGNLFTKCNFFFFLIYILSFILIIARGESYNLMLTGSAFETFAWWIPLGVFATSIYNKQILYDIFLKSSFIQLVLLTIMFICHPTTKYDEFGYNMFFGYSMVLPTLFHLNEVIKYRKYKFLLLVVLEFIMLLVYASRGVWMPILFFIAYRYILMPNANMIKRVLLSFFVVIFAFLIATAFFTFVSNYLESLGISSRTLDLLMNGEMVSYKSNRDIIWDTTEQMIRDKPLLGWGLGGEFYYLAQADGEIADASFTPHNGILQNIVNFGIIGGVIATAIFIIPYFNISKIKDQSYYDLVLIFGSSIIANFYSANGFFIKPSCSVFIFLFYSYYKWVNKNLENTRIKNNRL